MTHEEKLLRMHPIDPAKKDDKEFVRRRNEEFLIRSRRKAASMLNLDTKRMQADPLLKGTPKDAYLIELKGYEKRNAAAMGSGQPSTQPNMHEYYLVYPSGSGKNTGKRVNMGKHNIGRENFSEAAQLPNMARHHSEPFREPETPMQQRYPNWYEDEYDNRMFYRNDMNWQGGMGEPRHAMELRYDDEQEGRPLNMPSNYQNSQGNMMMNYPWN
jgi:hypothetical protein